MEMRHVTIEPVYSYRGHQSASTGHVFWQMTKLISECGIGLTIAGIKEARRVEEVLVTKVWCLSSVKESKKRRESIWFIVWDVRCRICVTASVLNESISLREVFIIMLPDTMIYLKERWTCILKLRILEQGPRHVSNIRNSDYSNRGRTRNGP